jgi:tripeptidyl-peptidase-1
VARPVKKGQNKSQAERFSLIMFFCILTLSGLVLSVLAAPSLPTHHVWHEKREKIPTGWVKAGRLQGTHVIPMRIALKQSNIESIEDYLLEVSHPGSAK